ncbi:MAG: hypothetical protein FD147_2563 [Chloroflexi bacterium]|nr:MAG: hypothetical protein FD147_2563 [Chloroflexota bacterium]
MKNFLKWFGSFRCFIRGHPFGCLDVHTRLTDQIRGTGIQYQSDHQSSAHDLTGRVDVFIYLHRMEPDPRSGLYGRRRQGAGCAGIHRDCWKPGYLCGQSAAAGCSSGQV